MSKDPCRRRDRMQQYKNGRALFVPWIHPTRITAEKVIILLPWIGSTKLRSTKKKKTPQNFNDYTLVPFIHMDFFWKLGIQEILGDLSMDCSYLSLYYS